MYFVLLEVSFEYPNMSLKVWLNVGTVWCWHVWGCFPNNFSRVRVCQWSDGVGAHAFKLLLLLPRPRPLTNERSVLLSRDQYWPITALLCQHSTLCLSWSSLANFPPWDTLTGTCLQTAPCPRPRLLGCILEMIQRSLFHIPRSQQILWRDIHWRTHTCLAWEITILFLDIIKFEGRCPRTIIGIAG